MKKKTISILLILAMILGMFPSAVFANTCMEHKDENHDHWCDICHEPHYTIDSLDSGESVCSSEGCNALETNVTAEYKSLNYFESEGEILAGGMINISVIVPNRNSESLEEKVDGGTVSLYWTDENEDIIKNNSIEDIPVSDGKATVFFGGLPEEALERGTVVYDPEEKEKYLPSSNGLVLSYQENVYTLQVDSNVDFSINGVSESGLAFFPGTELFIDLFADNKGSYSLEFDANNKDLEYEKKDKTISFIMPEADVDAVISWECDTHMDKDDHYCDVCGELAGECKDDNKDHLCDVCKKALTECTDSNGDHKCDTCQKLIASLCKDENNDHKCDVCEAVIEGKCADEDKDHYCDTKECGRKLTSCEESDKNGDNVCDVCEKRYYPEAAALGLKASKSDGAITVTWKALEAVGQDKVSVYKIYCREKGSEEPFETKEYVTTESVPFSYTFSGLESEKTYEVGVSAVYTEEINNEKPYEVTFKIDAELPMVPYTLLIAGEQVTAENKEDILGDGSKAVSYDPETHTLTLNNANIDAKNLGFAIRSGTYLNIELIGDNRIYNSKVYGLYSTDDVVIKGKGSLEIDVREVGIYIAGGFEIGGLTICEDAEVISKGGTVSSGNGYGVRVDDVLIVKDNAKLTASSATAPDRSCGIYAYDVVTVQDNAQVVTIGGELSGNPKTDSYGIRTTHVEVYGGSLTASGGKGADSCGIHTQTFDMDGGTVAVSGGSTADGTGFGPSLGVFSSKYLKINGGNITAEGGTAGADQSCGILVSKGCLTVNGGSISAAGGKANYSYGIKAAEVSVNGGNIAAEGAEGEWCSDGINVEGSMAVSGGVINASGNSADMFSYGIQAFELAIAGGDITAVSGNASNSYGLWAFKEIDISTSEIKFVPEQFKYISETSVYAGSESGKAVYSATAINIEEPLAVYFPEKGSVAEVDDIGGTYYTILDEEGTAAEHAEITPLIHTVIFTGISPEVSVQVIEGDSLNETYCESYDVSDFSQLLDIYRAGYYFKGWYTDESLAAENGFGFDDEINAATTLYPKWIKKSTGNIETSDADKETDSDNEAPDKKFDDVHDVNHWSVEAVDFVTEKGLFYGTGEDTFSPDISMTRESMWMVLARMSGEAPADMAEARAWAVEAGISDGTEPATPVSREQFVTMLWRAKAEPVSEQELGMYIDCDDISEWAVLAMKWAVETGVINGMGDGTLSPNNGATRAQVAQMFCNLLGNK